MILKVFLRTPESGAHTQEGGGDRWLQRGASNIKEREKREGERRRSPEQTAATAEADAKHWAEATADAVGAAVNHAFYTYYDVRALSLMNLQVM